MGDMGGISGMHGAKVLVTGGTGFLGQHVVKRLQKDGYQAYALGRNRDVGKRLEAQGICFVCADLSDRESVTHACKSMDFVIHCGALSSPWGKYEAYYQSNVVGTQNVIHGCHHAGVGRLIHVSTPSIYFRFDDVLNVTEDYPLPKPMVNHYAHTKLLAEQEIDKARLEKGMPVITIRPRGIFGEGDNAIIPRLIQANARIGVPMIRGGQALIDITYVENVVDALICCMYADEACLGRKYNITNDEPVHLADVLELLFTNLGVPFKKLRVPYDLAFGMAGLMEYTHSRFLNYKEPMLTRYSVSVLSKSQTLDISKAKSELKYRPAVSVDEGIRRFAVWYRQQQNIPEGTER